MYCFQLLLPHDFYFLVSLSLFSSSSLLHSKIIKIVYVDENTLSSPEIWIIEVTCYCLK